MAILSGLAAPGCLEAFTPDVGPLAQPPCATEDSDPTSEVSFERDLLGGVFARACLVCHAPTGATPIGIAVGGLDLSSYASLRRGGARGSDRIVKAGEPCASVLVQKVSDAPPFGARMPLEGIPLPEVDRQLIVDWIAEGAHEN